MRAVREHPRVVAARALLAALLVALGVGAGTLVDGGDRENRAEPLKARIESAQRSLIAHNAELRTARADARRAAMTADRAAAALQAARRTNRRLGRELTSERRALRRAKRRR